METALRTTTLGVRTARSGRQRLAASIVIRPRNEGKRCSGTVDTADAEILPSREERSQVIRRPVPLEVAFREAKMRDRDDRVPARREYSGPSPAPSPQDRRLGAGPGYRRQLGRRRREGERRRPENVGTTEVMIEIEPRDWAPRGQLEVGLLPQNRSRTGPGGEEISRKLAKSPRRRPDRCK